jgi:hypothetical protein
LLCIGSGIVDLRQELAVRHQETDSIPLQPGWYCHVKETEMSVKIMHLIYVSSSDSAVGRHLILITFCSRSSSILIRFSRCQAFLVVGAGHFTMFSGDIVPYFAVSFHYS